MGNALKDRQTPLELAARRQVIEIADKIGDFERLAGFVETELGALEPDSIPAGWRETEVRGRLSFGFAGDREDLPMLKGQVEASIYAVCQRCLEPMELSLEVRLELLLADGELDGFEAWELDGPTLRPADIVDEALVMAIPLSVLHGDSERCKAMTSAAEAAEDKTRPFAALREQMEQSD